MDPHITQREVDWAVIVTIICTLFAVSAILYIYVHPALAATVGALGYPLIGFTSERMAVKRERGNH